MPQLPSGRHIGLSNDRVLAWAERAGHGEVLLFRSLRGSDHLLWDVVDIVYFNVADGEAAGEGMPPGKPYLSGLTVEDVMGSESALSPVDREWFRQWLDTPRAIEWFGDLRQQVSDRLAVKELPPALVGLLDVDD